MPRISHSAPCLILLANLCVTAAFAQPEHATVPESPSAPDIDAPSATLRPQSFDSITVVADPGSVPEELIRAEADREVKTEETQRIAAVVPNFFTVIDGEGVPLDKTQKTQLAWRATIDPFNVVGAFVLGGASELQGTHRGFGWGAAGYGKRVGANLADAADGTMLAGAVYPILLHQDPRFFRLGTGSVPSRIRHALLAAFICRGDNGRTQPNYSNVLGNFTAGAISNAYYPANEKGASLTLLNAAIVTLEGSLGTIALEFAPDVQNRLHRRRESVAIAPQPIP